MQLMRDFYFLSICVQIYMFRASSAHRQESRTVHTASSSCVWVSLRLCLVRKLRPYATCEFPSAYFQFYYLHFSVYASPPFLIISSSCECLILLLLILLEIFYVVLSWNFCCLYWRKRRATQSIFTETSRSVIRFSLATFPAFKIIRLFAFSPIGILHSWLAFMWFVAKNV
jgi:hypothetical protein